MADSLAFKRDVYGAIAGFKEIAKQERMHCIASCPFLLSLALKRAFYEACRIEEIAMQDCKDCIAVLPLFMMERDIIMSVSVHHCLCLCLVDDY